MRITKELEYQTWVSNILLPYFFDNIVCYSMREKYNHGIPDIIAISDDLILAIELKFRKSPPINVSSRMFEYPISLMQKNFLNMWGNAASTAFVILGVGNIEKTYIFDYKAISSWESSKAVMFSEVENAVAVIDGFDNCYNDSYAIARDNIINFIKKDRLGK